MSLRAKDITQLISAGHFESTVSARSTIQTSASLIDHSADEYATPVTSGSFPISITFGGDKESWPSDQSVVVAYGTVPEQPGNKIRLRTEFYHPKATAKSICQSAIQWYWLFDAPKEVNRGETITISWSDPDHLDIREREVEFADREGTEGRLSSPFELIDLQAVELVQEEIDKILELARSDTQLLHSRLSDLLEFSKEEADCSIISPASVRFLRGFLDKNPNIITPSLFLADSGAIRAQWNVAPSKALALLFQPNGIAEYVLFAPDRRRPSITGDHAGSASWQSVLPSLRQSSTIAWLFSE